MRQSKNAFIYIYLGDYDYKCETDRYFNKVLDSNRKYKFFGILGNHEDAGECGESKYKKYVNILYDQMTNSKNSGTSCVFSPKKTMWSCVYKNMRIIGLSPSVSKEEKRDAQLAFLKKHLSESTEDWKLCAWHYYDDYYHTGKYQKNKNYVSSDGESFYDYCRNHGAIIFSAHDHVYARTHVMSQFSKPVIDSYDYKSPNNIVQIRKGATLNILDAVGGWEIYDEYGKQKDYAHWQKKYAKGSNSENAKKYGTLICKFNVGGNSKKSSCQFLRINSSDPVFDSFTIYRNDDPENTTYDEIDSRFLEEKIAAYQAKNGGVAPVAPATTRTTRTTTTTTTSTRSSPSESIKISTNDRCGSSYGKCPNDKCCSKYGYCDTSRQHCDIDQGCQVKYGICKYYTTTTKTSTKKTSTKKTSTKKSSTKKTSTKKSSSTSIPYSSSDRCGPKYGKCRNNECCSEYGWCSDSSEHCGRGCQPLYGRCK
ncbi:carbohydrate-binding module family 18 protein [Piromyces sp. E2]|nr:carbohydrate-binding module family 18 protein [Piromyces sp. E2]|eukprot:OUM63420.1 carbohydrate-binding module family 18 protein [Piromyces sp. E2]